MPSMWNDFVCDDIVLVLAVELILLSFRHILRMLVGLLEIRK